MRGDRVAVVAQLAKLVDLRRIDDCFPAIDYFEEHEIPFLVAVNLFDEQPRFELEEVREALGVIDRVPILDCDARKRDSVKEVLVALTENDEGRLRLFELGRVLVVLDRDALRVVAADLGLRPRERRDGERKTPALVFCFDRAVCWDTAEILKGRDVFAAGQRQALLDRLAARRLPRARIVP